MSAKNQCILAAIFLSAVNWHWSRMTERVVNGAKMTSVINFDGAGIAFLAGLVFFVFLVVGLFRVTRLLLDKPVRVPRTAKLVSWEPVPFLLPLFLNYQGTAVSVSGGATTTTSFGYGSVMGSALFALAVILAALYQLRAGFEAYQPVEK